MCGIVGSVRFSGAVNPELLVRQRDTMLHRGPDSAGIWISPDNRVGLAHRRLAIIDLSPAGHQPMIDRETGCVITFNGEIYNFAELRDRLRNLGQNFYTHGDTEVILAAYRQWGVDCLREIGGMFAFALFDPNANRVLLARDRAGEKPLFYRQSADVFSFASEAKALLEDPECPRKIRAESLNEYLAYGYVTGTNTMFADIMRLAPGHSAIVNINDRTVKHGEFWQLPHTSVNVDSRSEHEVVDELHSLLAASVRRQLTADVPVGVLLSGGVDSSIITAIAAEVCSTNIRTYTARFEGHSRFDEGPYARMVAEHLGTIHTELEVPPASADLLRQLVKQFDEPIADSSMIPTFLVSQEIRKHATVALGGDGGDELFGGYFRYPIHIRDERWRQSMPKFARGAAAWVGERVIPSGFPGRGRLSSLANDLGTGIANVGRIFRTDERSSLSAALSLLTSRELQAPELSRMAAMADRPTPVQRATAVDFSSYMIDDVLVKVDRASMLTSLEVRAPFLDSSVIEFAFSRVPDSLRATENDRKVLLRKLGAGLLPAKLDLHRKQGFSIPVDDWMRGPWANQLAEAEQETAPSIVSGTALQKYSRLLHNGRAVGERLFALVFLRMWEREYRVTDVI